jgi:hypothetical protein
MTADHLDTQPFALRLTKLILWLALVWSALVTCVALFVERDEGIRRAQRDANQLVMGHGPRDPQDELIWRLSWELNRYAGTPTIFVLAAGFLAIVASVEQLDRTVQRLEDIAKSKK